jgi:hypothetical protein
LRPLRIASSISNCRTLSDLTRSWASREKSGLRKNKIIKDTKIDLFFLNPDFSLEAQERVKSLSVRQFEIEEAIRNGLKYYLDTKDYVLRVKLFGEERSIGSIANEALPGFGQLNDPVGSGAKYWEIKRMRVDLVMHKEVSPSVNSYIGEIVPILSGLDYDRGDELIFVPILPSEPFPEKLEKPAEAEGLPDPMAEAVTEDEKAKKGEQKTEADSAFEEAEKLLEEEPFWLRMSDIEKILAGMLIFLILLFFWVLWKLKKVKENVSTEQIGYPALMPPNTNNHQLPSTPDQGLVSIPGPIDKLVESDGHPEYKVNNTMLNEENESLVQEIIKQLIGRDDWKLLNNFLNKTFILLVQHGIVHFIFWMSITFNQLVNRTWN